jgi:hypothetical protein
MVSIQKSDRSSSPPRRDGDADPARLLSRSCGLVSRAGSAAHHAHRQTQAQMQYVCSMPRNMALPLAHIAWYAVQGVMPCERVTARKREREREIERK